MKKRAVMILITAVLGLSSVVSPVCYAAAEESAETQEDAGGQGDGENDKNLLDKGAEIGSDLYDKIDEQLRSELLTALQPAFANISDQGIRYSSLPGHTKELSDALNKELSSTWGQVYGIEIVTCGVSSVKASEEDEQAIKNLQLGLAAGGNAAIAAGITVQANAQAMKDAAKNAGGAMMGFAGMGMAQQAGGVNVGQLMQQAQAQQAATQQQAAAPQMQAPSAAAGWTCPSCGQAGNAGKFCSNCGTAKPAEPEEWTCPNCGQTGNKGKFCPGCGTAKPAADSGSWTCPECGQTDNTGKFCSGCGKPRA